MTFFKKHSQAVVSAAAALIFLTLVAVTSAADAVPTASWGLSFGKEGEAPIGNATRKTLAAYDAVYLGDPSGKTLCLTFDCGYENGFTPQILDVLKAHGVPAAFFVVGSYVDREPELVRRMVEEGHTVGNHTMHHYDMSRIADRETFLRELRDVEERYEKVVGAPMKKYYRPPQGIFSGENLQMAHDAGYRTVFWSLAYVDWQNDRQPTPEQAFSKLLPRTHNGAVILLHATSATNAAILDELLSEWHDRGYTFCTLDELFSPEGAPEGNGN